MIPTFKNLIADQIKRINNMKSSNSFLDFLKDINDEPRQEQRD